MVRRDSTAASCASWLTPWKKAEGRKKEEGVGEGKQKMNQVTREGVIFCTFFSLHLQDGGQETVYSTYTIIIRCFMRAFAYNWTFVKRSSGLAHQHGDTPQFLPSRARIAVRTPAAVSGEVTGGHRHLTMSSL